MDDEHSTSTIGGSEVLTTTNLGAGSVEERGIPIVPGRGVVFGENLVLERTVAGARDLWGYNRHLVVRGIKILT